MARNDAKIRIALETKGAAAQLRQLGREGAKVAGRVAGGLRSAVGKGMGAVGMGAGIGTGLAAVKGATAGSVGDVIGESFGGIGAVLERSLLGDLGPKARADADAREQTIQAFGHIAGASGSIPEGAKQFFDQVQTFGMEKEKGRQMFETNDNFRSVGFTEVKDEVMKNIGVMLKDAVQWLKDEINPFK